MYWTVWVVWVLQYHWIPGVYVTANLKSETVPECKDGYELVPNSTMCLTDAEDFIKGEVTQKDIRIILEEHNKYRANVSPSATNMMKVYWDEELAKVAFKWARQCKTGHDEERFMPKYNTGAGQNAAAGFRKWKGAIRGWHDEVKLYTYGVPPSDYLGEGEWVKIGHYTQVVTDRVMLIGCGFAKCSSGYVRYYVCNYLSGQGNLDKPYNNGTRCSDCPDSCNDGLCDCSNKFCFNKGTLHINNCTCECKTPWFGPRCLDHPCGGKGCKHGGTLNTTSCECSCNYPYVGDTCETLECKKVLDPNYCGVSWKPSMCNIATVKDTCPVMCDVCEAPCNGKVCQHGGYLSVATCSCSCPTVYTGELCEILNCTGFKEATYCSNYKADDFCNKYSNGASTCPVLCGLCKGPCDGQKCLNGGELQTDTCTCKCAPIYRGESCETLNCEGHTDQYYCGTTYTPDLCVHYWEVKHDCAKMCGICKDDCGGIWCKNFGKLNKKTCECSCETYYTGEQCEIAKCPGKPDPKACGNGWPQSYCIYKNVPPHCPIMCGLCPPICGGKSCQNGGTLNVESCKCKCTKHFKGESCETFICPKTDPGYCGKSWPESYCELYANVPHDCPYMCGTCKK